MRDTFLFFSSLVLIGVIYINRNYMDGILMAIALYSLLSYWVLGGLRPIKLTLFSVVVTSKFKMSFILIAYLILNYFVIRNATNLLWEHILYCVLWFLISSGLLIFKWMGLKEHRNHEPLNSN